MAPVPPVALVCAVYALSYDPDPALRESAEKTFGRLPDAILNAALGSSELPPAVLDALAPRYVHRRDVQEKVLRHVAVEAETVELVAKTCDEALAEFIATNEKRLLLHPEIIAALYFNPATRMSTTDRILELAGRNNVKVPIPHFDAISAALTEQHKGDAALSDDDFRAALVEAEDCTLDDIEEDAEGVVALKGVADKVVKRIEDMSVTEKIRAAMLGNGAQRSLLIRSANRLVSAAVLESPKISDSEIIQFSTSRQVSENILRTIASNRNWFRIYEVKKNLVFNPKTPLGESLKILNHLMLQDVKKVLGSKGIPQGLRTAAQGVINKKKQ